MLIARPILKGGGKENPVLVDREVMIERNVTIERAGFFCAKK